MKSLRRLSATVFLLGRRFGAEAGNVQLNRKIRMMFRHTWLVTISALLLLAGVVGGGVYLAARPTVLKFAVGSASADDTRLVVSLAQQLQRDKARVRLRTLVKSTPEDAALAVDRNEADLMIVRADGKLPESGQSVAVLRHNVMVLMVPVQGSDAWGTPRGRAAKDMKGKRVDKLEQLAGRRIGVVGPVDEARGPLGAVLRQHEIAVEKVTLIQLDANDLAASLKDNPVDAMLAVAPVNSKLIQSAVFASSKGREVPKFLSVAASEAIAAKLPAYKSAEIKAGAFGGAPPRPDDAVETLGYPTYILARKGLSEAVITEFTRLLFLQRQRLAMDFAETAKIEAPDTDKAAEITVHPGAAAYIDDNQKTFFDRYDDLIYMGIMVLSFFGSAVAWFTSYLRADGRLRRLSVLERMLAIGHGAREATTAEMLDELHREVDDIVARTVKQAERPGFDTDGLQVLAFAVDHARYAILDRRAWLIAQPAGPSAAPAADNSPAARDEDAKLRPVAIVSR